MRAIINTDFVEYKAKHLSTKFWANYDLNATDRPKSITIYIHGDGLPWLAKNKIAEDPTPFYSLTWDLMQLDPNPSVFISRPCYFETQRVDPCSPPYWTNGRYSKTVINVLTNNILRFVDDQRIESITLIGYSGGGTIATLLAHALEARPKSDQGLKLERVVTLAANLDIEKWTEFHGYSALNTSLNPSDLAALSSFSKTKQYHFCGKGDRNIPPQLGREFFQNQHTQCIIVAASHTQGWLDQWPRLLTQLSAEDM